LNRTQKAYSMSYANIVNCIFVIAMVIKTCVLLKSNLYVIFVLVF